MSGVISDMRGDKYTKAVLIIAVVSLSTCTNAIGQKVRESSNSAKPELPLTAEARGIANQLATKRYTACGDFRLSYPELHLEGGRLMWGKRYIDPEDRIRVKELKSAAFGIEPEPLSEADRLNDIQWKGFTTVKWKASRSRWGPKGIGEDWGEWKDDSDAFRGGPMSATPLVKKNGQWFVVNPDYLVMGGSKYTALADFLATIVSPSCADTN